MLLSALSFTVLRHPRNARVPLSVPKFVGDTVAAVSLKLAGNGAAVYGGVAP